jgi:large subunit ribosomal protein L30
MRLLRPNDGAERRRGGPVLRASVARRSGRSAFRDSEDTSMVKKLKVTQVRSVIGTPKKKHRRVMIALGFRKNYRTLYKNDSPQVRGMLERVRHLVTWEEIDEKDIPAGRTGTPAFTVIEAAAEEPGEGALADETQ